MCNAVEARGCVDDSEMSLDEPCIILCISDIMLYISNMYINSHNIVQVSKQHTCMAITSISRF